MSKVDGGQWITLAMEDLMLTTHQILDVISGKSTIDIDEAVDLGFRNYMICDALDNALMHLFTTSTAMEEKMQIWLKQQDPEKAEEYESRIKEYHRTQKQVETFKDFYDEIGDDKDE